MESLLIIFGVFIVGLIFAHIYAGRELSPGETLQLARSSRIKSVWDSVGCEGYVGGLEYRDLRDVKKKMPPKGGIRKCDEARGEFPAFTAALLKGKKHEWWVLGWGQKDSVKQYWCNKGNDRESVMQGLGHEEILEISRKLNATVVFDIHNHPNPDPNQYNMLLSSEQDRVSVNVTGPYLSYSGISYLAFVAERGSLSLYAFFLPPRLEPFGKHLDAIRQAAAQGPSERRRLRSSAFKFPGNLNVDVAKLVGNIGGTDQ